MECLAANVCIRCREEGMWWRALAADTCREALTEGVRRLATMTLPNDRLLAAARPESGAQERKRIYPVRSPPWSTPRISSSVDPLIEKVDRATRSCHRIVKKGNGGGSGEIGATYCRLAVRH